jgi:putative CocE/NonD family hydrolase
MLVRRTLIFALVAAGFAQTGAAQEFDPPPVRSSSDTAFHAFITSLAQRLAGEYTNPDRELYLDNLTRIQIVAGDYRAALSTAEQLRAYRASKPEGVPVFGLAYEIYAATKAEQAAQKKSLLDALNHVFAERAEKIDDVTSAVAMPFALGALPNGVRVRLDPAIARAAESPKMQLATAVDLIRRYAALETYTLIAPELDRLLKEDDARRYLITRDVLVATPDGAHICALIVRPRSAGTARLPTLLNFTIYESDLNMFEARRSASHGYAAVEGLTRGKGCSPDAPISHEHDGTDATALIDWISRQSWSDGRVGMYGGSYEGFTQWAAAKHMPKALKAMMPSVTHAPGIDFPTDGGVFANYAYPWPFYTTNTKGLDSATYSDSTRWARLDTIWYKSGRPYRDLAAIDGHPNPIFDRWLSHPSYDAYWQRMIPYRNEFARIDIPILTTTGYYDGGQMGALHTFREHRKYAPRSQHYLVIGPYDHVTGQRGTVSIGRVVGPVVRGYQLDSAAHIDIGELRYKWFDYVFKGAPKPDVLRDVVNYEVMGGNLWKHAPSISRMANATKSVRLGRTVDQVVDLADRTDVAKWGSSRDLLDPSSSERAIIDTALNIAHGVVLKSEPLNEATEISGLFSGKLEFIVNKKDFDASIALFEQMPDGKYFQLSYHWMRMSCARDRTRRNLLIPGKPQQIAFEANRLTSRRLAKGSRIVMVIAIIKNPATQINYGTGRDVSRESIADAKEPLRIRWLPTTRVDVPMMIPSR